MLDAATPIECLEFIRVAIVSNDRTTALDIKNVLAEVCQNGHADRAAIWAALQGATNAPEPLQANVFKRSTSLKKFCLLTK